MKKTTAKTNAARILDRLKINYKIEAYKVDPDDLSAVHVAKETGMDIKTVFKTLVVRSDKNDIVMACIPGGDELSLKKLAHAAGHKKMEMIHLKELQPLTGYIRGGCSPLGAKKEYPVFIDESALQWEQIAISAGKRGEQIIIAPKDLISAVHATAAPLIK